MEPSVEFTTRRRAKKGDRNGLWLFKLLGVSNILSFCVMLLGRLPGYRGVCKSGVSVRVDKRKTGSRLGAQSQNFLLKNTTSDHSLCKQPHARHRHASTIKRYLHLRRRVFFICAMVLQKGDRASHFGSVLRILKNEVCGDFLST